MDKNERAQEAFKDTAERVVSAGVEEAARGYEKRTGKTMDIQMLKRILLRHDRGIVEKAMDLKANAKDLVDEENALKVLFSPQSINSRGDLSEEEKKAMLELVTSFDLTNPEKLGEFLVKLYVAQIEHFNQCFGLLEDLHLNDYSSLLADGETYLGRFETARNETDKAKNLEIADDAFIRAIHRFQGAIKIYVKDVQRIISKPRFLRSISLSKLDDDMRKLKGMLAALKELVALENLVGRKKADPQNDIMEEYQRFFDEVINANLPMLQDYCKDEDDAFWQDVQENGKTILLLE